MRRKEYQRKRAAMELRKAETERIIEEKIKENQPVEEVNDLHDEIYEIKQEIKFLDQNWDRRNWTRADYSLHDLITSNID